MAKSIKRIRIFSALEVANICGVVNQTAINWIRSGHLRAFTTPGGQYRVYAKDLAAFLDKRGMNVSGDVRQILTEAANWDSILIAADKISNDFIKNHAEEILPNYKIIQATDWFEVGKKFTEETPGFVLLDTELKGGNIPKFIQTIKKNSVFGRPFVLLMAEDSFDLGGGYTPDAVLTKPLDIEKLAEQIKSLENLFDSKVRSA